MSEEANNEKLMFRYLLGDISEEQRLQVEGMFLSDDQHYERLLAIEDELFYDYAQGKLSPGEREQFEKSFLSSERNRRKAMLASALAHKMSEAASYMAAESGLANREPQFSWQFLKSYFSVQSTAISLSLAALAVVLLISIWLVIGIRRLRSEFDQFRVQRAAQVDELHRQAQEERVRAADLKRKLDRENDENARLKKELSEIQVQYGEQKHKPLSLISLVLTPSVVRDQASGMKKLRIPPGVRLIKLRLNIKGEVEYKSYQVLLLTVEGVKRWSQDMLRAKKSGSVQSIDLWLPSRILVEGDYELRLMGYISDGTTEETGDYYYLSIGRE